MTLTFSRSLAGRITLVLLFGIVLAFNGLSGWQLTTVTVLLITLFPSRRRELVALGTICRLGLGGFPNWIAVNWVSHELGLYDWSGTPLVIVSAFVATWLACWLFYRFVRAWALPTLFAALLGLLLIAGYAKLPDEGRVLAWGLTVGFADCLWYLAYTLIDRDAGYRENFLLQIGRYLPFWGVTAVPFGKGGRYLSEIECRNEDEAASTRLQAFRLLLWYTLLNLGYALMQRYALGRKTPFDWFLELVPFGSVLPEWNQALLEVVEFDPRPRQYLWAAAFVHFLDVLLRIVVSGYAFVATLRLAGFKAPRNTWRLLESQSIADYWERSYFYLKELLDEVFARPLRARLFRNSPRAREFCASLVAVGLGSFLVTYLGHIFTPVKRGPIEAILALRVALFHSVVLGLAVALSRACRNAPSEQVSRPRRLLTTLAVFAFFFLLSMFDDFSFDFGLRDHLAFLAHLLGISYF